MKADAILTAKEMRMVGSRRSIGEIVGWFKWAILKKSAAEAMNGMVGNEDPMSFEALFDLICAKAEDGDAMENLNPEERVFYVVSMFNMEIQNGGLSQFFFNSPRALAPEVALSLRAIGADAYAGLYEGFCEETGVNVNEMDSFDIEKVCGLQAEGECDPFEDFDEAFYARYEKEPLEELMERYVCAHREKFH